MLNNLPQSQVRDSNLIELLSTLKQVTKLEISLYKRSCLNRYEFSNGIAATTVSNINERIWLTIARTQFQ